MLLFCWAISLWPFCDVRFILVPNQLTLFCFLCYFLHQVSVLFLSKSAHFYYPTVGYARVCWTSQIKS